MGNVLMTAKHLTKSITRDIIIVCSEQLSAIVNIHGEPDVTVSKPWSYLNSFFGSGPTLNKTTN